jgi:TolB-like protein/cytochrome c-type biogenesis protein CcmH/NrfG
MEQDEVGTLTALKERRRKVLEPLVSRHRGRVFKTAGDSVLVEFGSAVNAVQCAIDLQRGMAVANGDLPADRRIVLRIGVNLGDVMVEGGDLYGDGVNIAARLEGIAEPGGILISGSAYDQVKGKVDTGFEDLGSQSLKNIGETVRIYQSRPGREAAAALPASALPDKPSIAVLPFENMSADPEHAYFADGLAEDLITDLSKVSNLFVIARYSSFAYKGRLMDIRQVARELGVKYVLEGSARRAGGRVRINVQLIDAAAGGHVWAERFDRDVTDTFAVQDEIIEKIVEALVGRLTAAQLPERRRPANMEAYDLCVRGRAIFSHFHSPQDAREQRLLLERAIALEPEFAEAHRLLAISYSAAWLFGGEPREPNLRLGIAEAQKALALDPDDAEARWINARLLAVQGRLNEAEAEFAVALELDPNQADAWAMLSDLVTYGGRVTEALADIQEALRLNPHPPAWYYWLLGQAQYLNRQYDKAVQTLRLEETYRSPSRRILAASLAQLGRLDEARREGAMFMASNQHFTIRNWAESQPSGDEATREHFVDGYRKAGLPE